MLPPSGKINEWNTVATEFQNITLLDIIRMFNDRNSMNDQSLYAPNETHQVLDVIARHIGYSDRFDLKNRGQYSGGTFGSQLSYIQSTIDTLTKSFNTLAQLYGYKDHYDFLAKNESRIKEMQELTHPSNVNIDNKTLIKIDMRGNIWINGSVENNPTKIGKEIVKLAQVYRENFVISTIPEYLNVAESNNAPDFDDDLAF